MNLPDASPTLFLPGLFSERDLPADFLRMLARADRYTAPPVSGQGRLLALFGIDVPDDGDCPVAAITRIADMGIVDNDWWIRADPVHLAPQRDGLVLHAGLGLTAGESAQLVAELNETLAPEGWLLKAPHPERWYLKPPQAPLLRTTPLAEALGRNVHPLLPQGPDQRLWHTRLNEIQILLHTSPVNAEREARGLLPANSVWFWGGGRLPAAGAAPWATVWADDPFTIGLARLTGRRARPLAEYRPPARGALLVVEKDGEGVLNGIVRQLQDGILQPLTVIPARGPVFHCRPWHRWRFWRRATSLAHAP